MSEHELATLLEKAKQIHMTSDEIEEQRRSFAYGNANIENASVTRAMVDDAAEELARKPSDRASQST